MNNQEKFFAADLGADIPTLDLHGLYPDEALEKLELFLFDCYKKKVKICRIIYGAGTGKLRSVILEHLKKHPMVDEVEDKGGECVIVL